MTQDEQALQQAIREAHGVYHDWLIEHRRESEAEMHGALARGEPVPVYIVSTGKYSDYRINEICTDKKAAEALRVLLDADKGQWDDGTNELEMIYLDRQTADGPLWDVWLYSDADVIVNSAQNDHKQGDVICGAFNCSFRFTVAARDKAHAIKIAADKLMVLRANPHIMEQVKGLASYPTDQQLSSPEPASAGEEAESGISASASGHPD